MRPITVFFLMIGFCLFAQKKEIKYYDFAGNEVSKNQFHSKINHSHNLDIYIETDSLIIGKLINRKKHGKLNKIELSQLTQYLSKISGKQISSKIIFIHYIYYGNLDPKNQNWHYLEKDLGKLNKIDNVHYIFITNPGSLLLNFHENQIDWVEDTNRIIENVFFPFKFVTESFVVIDSRGNYISAYFEYSYQGIIDLIKEIKRN